MEDMDIVALYWARAQEAIERTDEKYGSYCFTVAQNILGSREDSEECVNDTWLGAWNAMPPHRPVVLRPFLAKLTRRLSFNRYRAATAQKRGSGEIAAVLDELRDCADPGGDPEGEAIATELGQAIRRFVRQLPPREGNLFVRRYFFTEPVAVAARHCGISENHAGVLLSRTRRKLRDHLRQEGFLHE